MDSADEKVVAVILVGGPSKGADFLNHFSISIYPLNLLHVPILMAILPGTRFRPLSFNTPEPLFPLAGQPMVHHHISACKRVCFQLNFEGDDCLWLML